jgi:hypothetical protein
MKTVDGNEEAQDTRRNANGRGERKVTTRGETQWIHPRALGPLLRLHQFNRLGVRLERDVYIPPLSANSK